MSRLSEHMSTTGVVPTAYLCTLRATCSAGAIPPCPEAGALYSVVSVCLGNIIQCAFASRLKAVYTQAPIHMTGCRRDELELMQRAIMGVENIFETQGLSISDQDLAEEVNEALEEARRQGTELDKERLREQAHELLKVGANAALLQLLASCMAEVI